MELVGGAVGRRSLAAACCGAVGAASGVGLGPAAACEGVVGVVACGVVVGVAAGRICASWGVGVVAG